LNIDAAKFVLLLFSLFFAFFTSLAAPGDLDSTFGGTGKIRLGLGSGSNRAHSVAVQADGKIVVAGSTSVGSFSQFALLRYHADGSLDATFGAGGIVITSFGTMESTANAVALQPDGKIVAAGYSFTGYYYNFAVARYNPDGSLDATFSDDGKIITSLDPSDDEAADVVIQPDGKIVAAGYTHVMATTAFAVVRYHPDGSLDTSFGEDGIARTIAGGSARANAVALQPDGKIVAAGRNSSNFVTTRYNPNGTLDATFGINGVVITTNGTNPDVAYDVAVQADGKVVICGTTVVFLGQNQFRGEFVLVRYNPDGSPDTTFDGDGIVSHYLNGAHENRLHSLAIQPDGKIVAGGYLVLSGSGNPSVFAVVRYHTNGTPDASFDGDGIATTVAGSSYSSAFGVATQADGKIVAAGIDNADFGNAALARFNADGSLDAATFGSGGTVSTDFGDSLSSAQDVLVQPDGKILAAGYNYHGFILARFNVNGTPDAAFGSGGVVRTPNTTGLNIIYAVALQPDGKIIAAGSGSVSANQRGFALARYNSDGSLDATFDGDGKVITAVGMFNSQAKAVVVQPDGKIIAAGDSEYNFALVRYNTDGSLDTTFDGDGKVVTIGGVNNGSEANAVAIQPDGKIVAAGYSYNGSNNDFAVARYNADGSLDSSFDTDGKVTTQASTANDEAHSLVIQPDGKIIAAGRGYSNGSHFTLARYKPDGSLDESFDADGIVKTAVTGNGGFATDVALQPDGKIVAAGNSGLYYVADFALVRYKPDGSLDDSFGAGGKKVFDISFEDNVYALALDNLGRIIVAGSAGDLFTVTRVVGDIAPANNAVISGRVTTPFGSGIRNEAIVLTGGGLTAPRFARTSSFGYYTFDNLTLGETYTVRIVSKRYTYASPARVVSLSANVGDADFVADAPQNKSGK
jgi:uncharacterized delta-60 repeat protein